MRLTTLNEDLASFGHTALDIGGLVPGVGEAADFANVVWYLKEQNYLYAALSLISMVPEIGDLIGKGAKIIIGNSRLLNKFVTKYGTKIEGGWKVSKQLAMKSPKLKKYVPHMERALSQVLSKATAVA